MQACAVRFEYKNVQFYSFESISTQLDTAIQNPVATFINCDPTQTFEALCHSATDAFSLNTANCEQKFLLKKGQPATIGSDVHEKIYAELPQTSQPFEKWVVITMMIGTQFVKSDRFPIMLSCPEAQYLSLTVNQAPTTSQYVLHKTNGIAVNEYDELTK